MQSSDLQRSYSWPVSRGAVGSDSVEIHRLVSYFIYFFSKSGSNTDNIEYEYERIAPLPMDMFFFRGRCFFIMKGAKYFFWKKEKQGKEKNPL